MPPKYNDLESDHVSDQAEGSDLFQVVPSVEETDDEEIPPAVSQDPVEEEGPSPPHPVVEFFLKALKFTLLPLCKLFFAPAAQRTFVKSTVMIVTISWILGSSLFAYVLFYNKYVPQIQHVQPIWFQYDQQGLGPTAIVEVVAKGSVPLRREQLYDISVQLHVPTSDVNFDLGNFMIDVQLQTANGSAIIRASRPGILRYQSRTQRVMRVFAKAIPLLIGLSEESQVITVQLIENFRELGSQVVNKVEVSLSDPRIQIYDAKLLILANFHGLCYYMYYHRILTALTFCSIFAIIEFTFATLAWKGFGEALWHKLYQVYMDYEDLVTAEPPAELDQVSDASSEKSA